MSDSPAPPADRPKRPGRPAPPAPPEGPGRPGRPQKAAKPQTKYRRLVRCGSCCKQFDAGELAPGERFHCLCGALLEVPASAPQEAPVVRCAACGAPRAAGAVNCTFCAAPFALGEGARNTICPVCASRIGDRQRFCHACGSEIAPEGVVGERTEFSCPSCRPARPLSSRRIPDAATALAMLECGSCAGIWLGHTTFESLQQRARREVVAESLARPQAPVSAVPPGAARTAAPVAYRPCPVCQKLMIRRNFAGASGIVIDVCGTDGLWFDAAELDGVLAWIRAGGLGRSEARLAEERREAERRAARAKKELQDLEVEQSPERHWLDMLGSLVDFVLGAGRLR
ncbi:MAG: zf-TFIIB domain-containing protein [Thermoanaerobaculia bacterium]|nr:zf-TFIIB domain-containing protein [Thermoanaerobaculia bacterium]